VTLHRRRCGKLPLPVRVCDWFKPSDKAFDPARKDEAQAAEQALAALFGDD